VSRENFFSSEKTKTARRLGRQDDLAKYIYFVSSKGLETARRHCRQDETEEEDEF